MTNEANSSVLKAILFADLAQYSRLTAANESATVDLVTGCLEHFRELCSVHRGDFIKSTGDGALAVFDSVTDALDYSLGIQEKLAQLAATDPAAGRFPIGLDLG